MTNKTTTTTTTTNTTAGNMISVNACNTLDNFAVLHRKTTGDLAQLLQAVESLNNVDKQLKSDLVNKIRGLLTEKSLDLRKRMEAVRTEEERIKEREKKNAAKADRARKALARKIEYNKSHLYVTTSFAIKGQANKVLGGFIFDNAIAITNYDSNAYVVITKDKLARLFISCYTRVKDAAKGGNFSIKQELVLNNQKLVQKRFLDSFYGRSFDDILENAKTCKSFKAVCKNERIKNVVKSCVYNASRYDKPNK